MEPRGLNQCRFQLFDLSFCYFAKRSVTSRSNAPQFEMALGDNVRLNNKRTVITGVYQ